MAPAGSFEALQAALKAGADSVYFGVGKLNMRARAAMNFTDRDLPAVVERCRMARARAYLTVNTIVYDEEFDQIAMTCRQAAEAGIDAIIAADVAAIQAARETGVPVHISTQANVSNLAAVKFHSSWADVVVLARELRLDQIAAIHRGIREQGIRGPSGELVKIEAFVHGALCVAVSGHCGMSLAAYDHSANRGDCFQNCRRTYRVRDLETDHEFVVDNHFVMSPRDLCTIACLDDLIGAGVGVLKIEGRGRGADYVFETVRCYREAADSLLDGSYSREKVEVWRERLRSVFNRDFWEGGFYLGRRTGIWSGAEGNQATQVKRQVGLVTNYYPRAGVAEVAVQTVALERGAQLLISGETTGPLYLQVDQLRHEDREIDRIEKGTGVTFPVPEKVRRGDRVFVLTERE